MRYIISGILAGLLVGALTPMPFVFGHTCTDVDLDHSSQSTNCCEGCHEDHAVDTITYSGAGTEEICITRQTCTGCTGAALFAPSRCQCHGEDPLNYTVSTNRSDPAIPSTFETDSEVHDDECSQIDNHVFVKTCN